MLGRRRIASSVLVFVVGVGVGAVVAQRRDTPPAPVRKVVAPDPPQPEVAPSILALPDVQKPEADGVITGRVVDKAGRGIRGARLRLFAIPRSSERKAALEAYAHDDPVVQRALASVWKERWEEAYGQSTTSDEEGHFRFAHVTNHRHRMEAHESAHALEAQAGSFSEDLLPGSHMVFEGDPVGEVLLHFRNQSAPVVADVILKQGRYRTLRRTWRKLAPAMRVPIGEWDVEVRVSGAEGYGQGQSKVHLKHAGDNEVAQITIELRASLEIELVFSEDQVIPFYVYLVPDGSEDLSLRELQDAPTSQHRILGVDRRLLYPNTRTFRLSAQDLEPGQYVVRVVAEQGMPDHYREYVKIGAGRNKQRIEVPPLDPKTYLLVDVKTADGVPVRNARFWTGTHTQSSGSAGPAYSRRRKDGLYLVLHRHPQRLGAVYWLDTTAPGQGVKRIAYQPKKGQILEVQYLKPASIDLQVRGVSGSRYEGRVSVVIHGTEKGESRRLDDGWTIDMPKDCSMKLEGIQPGPTIVLLALNKGRGTPLPIARWDVELTSGDTTPLELKMPELVELAVRGLEDSVYISGKQKLGRAAYQRRAYPDPQGVARFEGLPPGTYSLRSRRRTMEVTVPDETDVTLPPAPPRRRR